MGILRGGSDNWPLWVMNVVCLVICFGTFIVVRVPHCLLSHLTLVHVTWGLVVVREGSERGDERKHCGFVDFPSRFADIGWKSADFHKDLLKWADELGFLLDVVEHRPHHPLLVCEDVNRPCESTGWK